MTKIKGFFYTVIIIGVLGFLGSWFGIFIPPQPPGDEKDNNHIVYLADWESGRTSIDVTVTFSAGMDKRGPFTLHNVNARTLSGWTYTYEKTIGTFDIATLKIESSLADSITCTILRNGTPRKPSAGPIKGKGSVYCYD